MGKSLTEFKVLTFDCYGTLIDWECGIWDCLQPLLAGNNCDSVDRVTGLKLFARYESRQQRATPKLRYCELLALVHSRMAEHLGLASSAELDAAFGQSVAHWPAFGDTADALRVLKRHFRLVILSNVDRAGFAASNRKLGVEFDAIYTAEDIGSYKPDQANFRYLLSHLHSDFGLEPDAVLHTAQSLHHDHVPARANGLANAWIDRQRLSEGGHWGATVAVKEKPDVDFLFFTMQDMVDAVLMETS